MSDPVPLLLAGLVLWASLSSFYLFLLFDQWFHKKEYGVGRLRHLYHLWWLRQEMLNYYWQYWDRH